MLDRVGNLWWMFMLRGALAIVFAFCAFVWPEVTVGALILIFGVFCLIDGVTALISAFGSESWLWSVVHGVIGIGIGLVTFFWPQVTAITLLVIIGIWAILKGIGEIGLAIDLRKIMKREWLLWVAGIASILFGLLLILRPGTGALAVLWLIALFAVFYGILFVILGWKLRSLKSGVKERIGSLVG